MYIFAKADTADHENIKKFLSVHFDLNKPQNQSDWLKWQEQRPSFHHIQLVKDNQRNIIALSFFLPYKLKTLEGTHSAAFSISTMVSKEFRKKGLGGKIHDERLNYFDFALSSGQSDANHSLYKKKGFHVLGEYEFALAQKKFPSFHFSKFYIHQLLSWVKIFFLRLFKSSKFEISYLNQLPNNIPDDFFQNRLPSDSVFPIHDGSYLEWRYIKHPYLCYDLVGAYDGQNLKGIIVVRQDKERLNIIDIYCCEKDMKDVALSFIKEADTSNIFSLFVGKPIRKPLKKAGMYTYSYGGHYMGLSKSENLNHLLFNHHWCLFWGDSDKDR